VGGARTHRGLTKLRAVLISILPLLMNTDLLTLLLIIDLLTIREIGKKANTGGRDT